MRKKIIKDNLRRLILILMTTALMFSLALPVSAAEASGTCGNSVSWSLSPGGILTISGSGAMLSYSKFNPAPWNDYREEIRVIVVENGVTTVGNYAFYDLDLVTSVSLASSVISIGRFAFAESRNLKMLTLGSGLQTIGENAFDSCASLQIVRFPNTLKSIGESAFYRCYSLQSIIIPASVTDLGAMVFAYCDSLINAEIRASISELPFWTFYGCESLSTVSLAGNITSIGRNTFYECTRFNRLNYAGSEMNGESLITDIRESGLENFSSNNLRYSSASLTTGDAYHSQITDDQIVHNHTNISTTDNATISKTVTETTEYRVTEGENMIAGESQISVTIEAVIENKDGWSELVEEIKEGEKENLNDNQIKVDVSLNDTQEIAGETLNDLAGKNVYVTIDMKDGSTVKIDCTRLEAKEEKKTEEKYELSYTLTPNTEPTKSQIKTLADAESYLLSFDGSADFDFSPKIYIGKDKAYSTATLYQNVPGRGLSFLQSVVVDKSGYATFYLQSTKASTEYLIGLNVTAVDASSAIIPEDIAAEYGDVMYYESIQYVTTGVRLFMGLSLFQFAIAVLCVMLFLFLIVGIVMGVVYRKKKLEMYYQLLKERQA